MSSLRDVNISTSLYTIFRAVDMLTKDVDMFILTPKNVDMLREDVDMFIHIHILS